VGEPIKAVALLSGGLDSTLSVKLVADQGVEVMALNFSTGFCLTDHRRVIQRRRESPERLRNEALRAGADLGIPVEIIDISQEYMHVLTHPKYGYGSAINPCIDCRILMLKKAKAYMEQIGAHFVITGEVLGQRPMTQHFKTLMLIERESGLERLIVRPLSAKLLPLSIPEEKGWVDRERFYAIRGRSRKEQMRLAQQLGIKDYPQPAGGCCFLVDENYARRMRDLFAHKGKDNISFEDVILLKVGRHFRVGDHLKVVVGRDEAENRFLERYRKGRWAFEAMDFKGPLVLAEGDLSPEDIHTVASITARYCDGRDQSRIRVTYESSSHKGLVEVTPAADDQLARWRV